MGSVGSNRRFSSRHFFAEADIAVSVRIEANAEERDLTCDNTSRPGFRVDPPFAWETAHEAYFGAVASAQDLLEVTPVSPANLEETGSDLPYGRPG